MFNITNKKIFLVTLVILLLSVLGYAARKHQLQNSPTPAQPSTKSISPTTQTKKERVEINTYTNTLYGYQFAYPNNLVSLSAANKEAIKPLTDADAQTTNNLIVGDAQGHNIMQIEVIRNQDEASALFEIHKLNDKAIWSNPTKVTLNGMQLSKYVAEDLSHDNSVESYYGTDDKIYFYIGLFNKTEGNQILSTLKFMK